LQEISLHGHGAIVESDENWRERERWESSSLGSCMVMSCSIDENGERERERERETEMGEIIKLRFLHLHEGKLFHLMRVERDGDGGSSLR